MKQPRPTLLPTHSAPFECSAEESPEPAQDPTLEYDLLDDEECCESDTESVNFEVSSLADDESHVGSLSTSPTLNFFEHRRSVKVEKAQPPGIEVTLDDDSWIV